MLQVAYVKDQLLPIQQLLWHNQPVLNLTNTGMDKIAFNAIFLISGITVQTSVNNAEVTWNTMLVRKNAFNVQQIQFMI